MKKILFAVLLLSVLASVSWAEGISTILSSHWVGKYVGGSGTVFHDGPAVQSELTVAFSNGVYVDVWHSAGTDDSDLSSNYADELDYTLGYAGEGKGIGFDLGVSYFDIFEVAKFGAGDVVNAYAEVSKGFELSEAQTISAKVKAQTYFLLLEGGGNPENDGADFALVGEHAWKVSESVALTQSVVAVFDDGANGGDSGIIGTYIANASWNVSGPFSVDVSLNAYTPLTHVEDGRTTEIVPSVGVNFEF